MGSKLIIWLSGPTGGGKTSIAHSLRQCGLSIVEECLPEDLFRSFATKPIEHCEALQRYVMSARLNGWRTVATSNSVVFDRSIDEDIEVFCRMHKAAGLLTQSQFDALADLANELQEQMPDPDLIVFITAESRVLLRRLREGGAPGPIVESLDAQISLYSRWLKSRAQHVMGLDTTRMSERAMAQLLSEIRTC